jgi:hypothetical protein
MSKESPSSLLNTMQQQKITRSRREPRLPPRLFKMEETRDEGEDEETEEEETEEEEMEEEETEGGTRTRTRLWGGRTRTSWWRVTSV